MCVCVCFVFIDPFTIRKRRFDWIMQQRTARNEAKEYLGLWKEEHENPTQVDESKFLHLGEYTIADRPIVGACVCVCVVTCLKNPSSPIARIHYAQNTDDGKRKWGST